MGGIVGFGAVGLDVCEGAEIGAIGWSLASGLAGGGRVCMGVREVIVKVVLASIVVGGGVWIDGNALCARVVAVRIYEVSGVIGTVVHDVFEGSVAEGAKEWRVFGFRRVGEAEASKGSGGVEVDDGADEVHVGTKGIAIGGVEIGEEGGLDVFLACVRELGVDL